MKILRIMLVVFFVLMVGKAGWAITGVLATDQDISMLKKDLLSGKVQVGKTRLAEISKNYGDASDINSTDKRITYNYKDLKLVIEKQRLLRDWSYDSFKTAVYSDSVENLRFDLESGELAGDNIRYSKISRTYDNPTEIDESQEDGAQSIYYYGNIKLVFENYFVLKSWKGANLGKVLTADTLQDK